jgi:uncharacterized membrane protein (DUF4010 family)
MGLGDLALRFGVALAAGLLIGTDRERRKVEGTPGHGIRTFALAALAGAASELIGGTPLLAVVTGGFALLAAAAYPRTATPPPGLTTAAALLVTVLIGALAVQQPELATGVAVTVTILLSLRERIHRFVKTALTETELDDLLVLGAAALVIFPLIPDRYMGPYDALNPRTIWRVVVLVMTIQAAGYIAQRVLGARCGLPLAGFASGFVSSMATVAAMCARARTEPPLLASATAAAALSTIATVTQTAVILATTSQPLLERLAIPLACVGATATAYGVAFTVIALREPAPNDVARGHAVNVRMALLLAGLIAVVLVVSAALNAALGHNGVTIAAIVAGFVDAHAPTASSASLVASHKLGVAEAVVPVLGAFTTNTATKIVLAFTNGGRAFALRIVPGLVLCAVAAWLGALAVR